MHQGGLAFNKTLLLLKLLCSLFFNSLEWLVLYASHRGTYKHTMDKIRKQLLNSSNRTKQRHETNLLSRRSMDIKNTENGFKMVKI